MEYIEEKAQWNDLFYSWLNTKIQDYNDAKKKGQELYTILQYVEKYIIEENFDFSQVVYKKLVDEEESIEIEGKYYKLLPMGLRNSGIPTRFVGNNKFFYTSLTDKVLESIVSSETYDIFYYPDDRETPDWTLFDKICKSYIEHYRESLDEPWEEKRFYRMVKNLKVLSVKYAQDIETKEIFAVGFFGAYIRDGATGECLTNAELYVMPEFRRKGIAKKLVGLTFDRALAKNIYDFDSVTYRLPNQDALSFWQSVGAEVSGLYHIEGNIEQMEQIISEKTGPRKK